MDTRALFQKVSQKMRADFEASSQIQHAGSKGTVRENFLRRFLSERLPQKFGLGAGEVVGRIRKTSRQCDVIVFDAANGVRLFADENVQIFPVDCVYGVIEVKSSLSKAEFLDALEKVKAFKELAPGGAVAEPLANGWTMQHARPRPFGMIFAYSLGGNSLDSLQENLREWEKNTPATLWPNYVCVLEAGIICHHRKAFETCLTSDQITSGCWPIALHYGEDSLFRFFCALHDICVQMRLGPVELHHYDEPSEQIGSHIVEIPPLTVARVDQPSKRVRPSVAMIEKIVSWCAANGPIRYEELLQKRFGSVPLGLEWLAANRVFLYNPNNLPGLHEVKGPLLEMTETGPKATQPSLVNLLEFRIDGELYAVAWDAFTDADFEEID